jgi:aspartate kinase
MKFGGTSVQDAATMKQVIAMVKSRLDRQPIVVVSAAAGITDTLIRCCQLAHEDKKAESRELIDDGIVRRHQALVNDLIHDSTLRKSTLDQVVSYANEIRNLTDGLTSTNELSARSLDAVAAYGEQFTTAILSAAMKEFGLESILIDARRVIITDENHGNSAPLMDISAARAREILLPAVEAGAIPVTQGFIGSTLDGATTTLGRNGSDYSAAIIGSLVDADVVEIWTDVDGILSADPKLVPGARLLETVTFQEASEMAHFGAKVLHPNTTLPLQQKKIPVHVYNTKRPQSSGTRVVVSNGSKIQKGQVKTIAYRKGIAVINIHSPRNCLDHSTLSAIFGVFHKFETRIYLTRTSAADVSIAIDDVQHVDAIVKELKDSFAVTVENGKAAVCLIGEIAQDTSNIVARGLSAIQGMKADAASNGTSGLSVSFLINQPDLKVAVQKLHREFFEDPA